MDELELLHDDHTLLSSQVTYVVTLVKSLGGGSTASGPLFSEVTRQMELLKQQLVEHFLFEEKEIFPKLHAQFPGVSPRLAELQAQHERLLAAFDAVSGGLLLGQPVPPESLARSDEFGALFAQHAIDENDLLKELSSTPK